MSFTGAVVEYTLVFISKCLEPRLISFKMQYKFTINGKVKQFKGPLSIIVNLRGAIIEITADETFLRSTSLCNFLLCFRRNEC